VCGPSRPPRPGDRYEPSQRHRNGRSAPDAGPRLSLHPDSGAVAVMRPEIILKAAILIAAFASFVLSVTLYFQAGDDTNARLNGIYVGIWVPSILALGAFILSGPQRSGK